MSYERVDIGEHTLYRGDALSVLPNLAKRSVDMVLSDPPYGVAYSTGRRLAGIRSSTRLSNDHLLSPLLNDAVDAMSPLLNDAVDAMSPLLNDAGVMYLFAAPERLDDVMPAIRKRLEIVNVIVWDKGNCTAGDLETTYGQQWEACIYARKKRVALSGGRDRDIVRISRGNTAEYLHPTQKPVDLMQYLLSRHEQAECVLDPFMGSGTTLVACHRLGRRGVGVELDARYFDIACRRLETELASTPLWEPPPVVQQTMFGGAA